MKFVVLSLISFTLSFTLSAQSVTTDTVKNQRILIDEVKRDHIADSTWFKDNYNAGIVTAANLSAIDKNSEGITIEIYFGSWCDDSQYWVPAFLGLTDKTNMVDKIQLIALSRSKKSEETIKLGEIIDKVPTFVFLENGKEIGRIVESPQETLAKDMIQILKQ